MSGMDPRELLLIETYVSGGNMRDNDVGYEGAAGALVLSEDMESVLRIGPEKRRVCIPVTELHERGANEAVDQLLWTAAFLRESIPVAAAGGLLDELHKQVPFEVQKLYAKPGTPAWDRAVSEANGLPVIEALGNWGSWALGGSVVLGLPYQENLGVSLQPGGGLQGLCIFPRFVAAAWVVG